MASIRVYPYLSPRVIEVLAPDTEVTVQELVNLVRDWEDEDDNMSFEFLISAAGKESLGGGILVGITASLNNAQIMFEPRTTKLDDGSGRTCDAADTFGRQLYVNDATFITDNIVRGDLVYNTSDSSFATVLEVIDENTISHMPLQGGVNNDWEIGDTYIVYDTEQCSISGGNLVATDNLGADIPSTLYSFGTQVIRSSSSSATLQELDAIQFSSYEGGVTIDIANTTGKAKSGVVFPIGTPKVPVNNLDDLLIISNITGLEDIYVIGDLSITSGYDFSGYSFIGQSALKSIININPGVSIDGAEFRDATITGTFGVNHEVKSCILDTVLNLGGLIIECGFTNTFQVAAASLTEVWEGKSRVPGPTTPIIDLNETGVVSWRDYEGGAKFTNYSGSSAHTISLSEGQVILDSATITGGTWVVRGIGKLVDENGTLIESGTWNGTVTIINELLTAGNIGGGDTVWTTEEKDKIISDTEIIKDQSKLSALHAVNELNNK